MGSRTADHLGAIGEDPAEDGEASDAETVTSLNTEGNRDGSNFLTRPYWLSDEGLKKGEVDVLSLQEEQFWKDLLEKYLYPIDEDKAEKVKRRANYSEADLNIPLIGEIGICFVNFFCEFLWFICFFQI